MGSIFSCILTQANVFITTATCNACMLSCIVKSEKAARIAYVVLFLFSCLLAIFVNSQWITSKIAKIPTIASDFIKAHCIVTGACDINDMVGPMAVARVSFAMSCFFLYMALFSFKLKTINDWRFSIHNGYWGVKFFLIICTVFMSFLISNSFFYIFVYVAMIGSAIYILVQLLLLIDFSYEFSETWVQKYEDTGDSMWFYLIMGVILIGTVLVLVGNGLMYFLLTSPGECHKRMVFITINLVLSFLSCGLSIHPRIQEYNETSGLIQSLTVSCYSTFLIFSALLYSPVESLKECGSLNGNINIEGFSKNISDTMTILGVFITFSSIIYSTVSMPGTLESLLGVVNFEGNDTNFDEPLLVDPKAAIISKPFTKTTKIGGYNGERIFEKELELESESEEIMSSEYAKISDYGGNRKCSWSSFHFSMALASMYIMMTITNWQVFEQNSEAYEMANTKLAMYVKIISSYMVYGLYLWSLVAPAIFPDREFN